MYVIRSDAGQPLREELAKSPHKILSYAFPEILPTSDAILNATASTPPAASSGDEKPISMQSESSNTLLIKSNVASDAYFQGLYLIKTMVKLIPSWLQSNRTIFDALTLLWKSHARTSRLQNEQELNLVQVVSSSPELYNFCICFVFQTKIKCILLMVPYLKLMWASVTTSGSQIRLL